MKHNNSHRDQYHSSAKNSVDYEGDSEWHDPEDIIHAKKKHQSHRNRHNEQKRRHLNGQSDQYGMEG